MLSFDHEKLDVYKAAIDFFMLANEIAEGLPRGKAFLADQLLRASSSITLNIAEGAGEFSGNEKCRFYRMAKRSTTECAGILDLCNRLRLVEETKHLQGRELLLRIVAAMLTRLARGTVNSGSTKD